MSCVGGTAIAVVAGNVAGAVSFQSLEARLRGPSCDCGVARQAQRAQELTARRWRVHPFAGQAGYRVGIDAAAAVFVHGGEPDAAPPPAMTGSHIDTPPPVGWLDAAFGVAAGPGVFDALDRLGARTQRPLDGVMWTNQQGLRFAPGLMGCVAYTALVRLAVFLRGCDSEGRRFKAARDAAVRDLRAEAQQQGGAVGQPIDRARCAGQR